MATDRSEVLGEDAKNPEIDRHLQVVPSVELERQPLGPNSPEYWRSFVESYSTSDDESTDWQSFHFMIASVLRSAKPENGSALIECLATSRDKEMQLAAAEAADYLVAYGDEETVFRVTRALFENDEVAELTMFSIADSNLSLPEENIGKTLDALKTRWWERLQGLRVEVDAVRALQAALAEKPANTPGQEV